MTSSPAQTIARTLLDIGAVSFRPDHPVRFKSGLLSPIYVDNRRLPFHPDAWRLVIAGFEALIGERALSFDALAGVAVGGVPHSSALGYALHRPSVFVRKEAKEHGRGQQIEGGDVAGLRILLVEDLVTTGGSSLEGVAALRRAGAGVDAVLAIISYGFAEARVAFAQADVTLHTLTDFDAILSQARFGPGEREIIAEWLTDPYEWTRTREDTP